MKGKMFKRTIAAIMALVIVCGTAPVIPGGIMRVNNICANAAGSATLDENTGVLTLSGEITKSQVSAYQYKSVKKIVAAEGTVLPADCSELFEFMQSVRSIDLSKADKSQVTDMQSMFVGCDYVESIDLGSSKTGKITSLICAFEYCSHLKKIDLSSLDLTDLKGIHSAFDDCQSLESIVFPDINTSSITIMNCLFNDCKSLKSLDISGFDTRNVTDAFYMFQGCENLRTIYAGENTVFDNAASDHNLFVQCYSLIGENGTKYSSSQNKADYARIDKEGQPGYFSSSPCKFDEATGVLTLVAPITREDIEKYKDDSRVRKVVAAPWALLPDNCAGLFKDFTYLTEVDLSSVYSNDIYSLTDMFYGCTNLVTVDISGIDSSVIDHMDKAFYNCHKLKTIYVSQYWGDGTAAYASSSDVFYNCSLLVGGSGTACNGTSNIDGDYARIDRKNENKGYFSIHDSGIDYDSSTGVLTIYGNVNKQDLSEYRNSAKKVVFTNKAVLPESCDNLFQSFRYVTEIDLSDADFTNVKSMYRMFVNCQALTTVKFSYYASYTFNLTNMKQMFMSCKSLENIVNFRYINTENVTDMKDMFRNCSSLTSIDIHHFDMSNVTTTEAMFSGCSSLEEISLDCFRNNKITTTYDMFKDCTSLKKLDLFYFDTSSVTNMSYMFADCTSLEALNIANFDTSSLTTTSLMFYNCNALKTIIVGDRWNLDNVTKSGSMFDNCTSLVGGAGTAYSIDYAYDKSMAKIDGGSGAPGYMTASKLSYDLKTKTLTLRGSFDYEDVKYYADKGVKKIIADNTAVLPSDCSNLFQGFNFVREIDLSKADASNVTDMQCMFYGLRALTSIDLSGLKTNNVTKMNGMFRCCESLEALDLSSFNTAKVTDMSSLFSGCYSLETLDLSSFNTAKVTNMSTLFSGCESLETLDLSRFNTAKVTDMSSLFSGCYSLETLDLSSFNTAKVMYMEFMFANCKCLKSVDVHSFDTHNVVKMYNMFENCQSLKKLDLSSFVIDSLKYCGSMFYNCYGLNTIYVSDDWEVPACLLETSPEYNGSGSWEMFYKCWSLVGGNGTTYNENNIKSSYAQIDGKNDSPGYLTRKSGNTENPLRKITFSHNVALNNNLGIIYYIPADKLKGFTNVRLVLDKEVYDHDSIEGITTSTLSTYKIENSGYGDEYVFRYNNIAAKEMGNTVRATLVAEKDGVVYKSKVDEYSIKKYAMNKLNNNGTSSKLKTLLVDMLNYGSQAQQYFCYNMSSYANKDLTSDMKALGTDFDSITLQSDYAEEKHPSPKAHFTGKNLSLGNNIGIVYYMTFDDSVDKENVNLYINYQTINGYKFGKIVPFSQFTAGDYPNEYRYDFTDLAAKDSLQPVTAFIAENGTVLSDKITYSIPTYAYNKLNNPKTKEGLKTIIKAMIVYYNSAKNYFA